MPSVKRSKLRTNPLSQQQPPPRELLRRVKRLPPLFQQALEVGLGVMRQEANRQKQALALETPPDDSQSQPQEPAVSPQT